MERLQTTQLHTLYLIKEAVKTWFYENDANADNKQQNQAQSCQICNEKQRLVPYTSPFTDPEQAPKYMMSPGGKATH